METFANEDLLEPIDLYKTRLKDAFHENAVKRFEEMERKGNVDVAANQRECKIYYTEQALGDQVQKKVNGRKALRTLSLIFGIILIVFGIVWLAFLNDNLNLSSGLKFGISIPAMAVGVALFVIFFLMKKGITEMQKIADEHYAKAKVALDNAWKIMQPLNSQYEYNMAAELMSKTTPLIQLDKTFDGEKFQFLHEKYGFNENSYRDTSAVYVQSGSILGNPFIFEKNYCQSMRDHRYSGTLTITYTKRVYNGKNWTTEVVTQVLTAYVTKPEPWYYYDTVLIYGNEAAPHLSFSRRPTDINNMNDKQLEHYIKNFDKKLDKEVKKDMMKGDGSFTRLANEEFEALFNALDRDNETEFRLLFTPLAQKNMIKLLRGKDIGFGDDFMFRKKKMLNIIRSGHMQGSDSLDKNPKDFMSFDYKKAKDLFVNYCDKYLKDVFFDLAPVISIPLYQQHKTIEYIYKNKFAHNVTQLEAEAAANSHDINLFKHPATRSAGVILKSFFQRKEADVDICNVTAYSFEGIERIEYVPTLGGDGKMHNVPVHWIEYLPIEKTTPFAVTDTKNDLAGYKALYETGKFNEMINKFNHSGDMIYKKRLFSFVLKDNK